MNVLLKYLGKIDAQDLCIFNEPYAHILSIEFRIIVPYIYIYMYSDIQNGSNF